MKDFVCKTCPMYVHVCTYENRYTIRILFSLFQAASEEVKSEWVKCLTHLLELQMHQLRGKPTYVGSRTGFSLIVLDACYYFYN